MVVSATDAGDRRLDELVPPPWGLGRRTVAIGAAFLTVALTIGVVVSGLAGPRLSHTMDWGGAVDGADPEALVVHRIVAVRNDGWMPVTLLSFAPPALEHVTWGQTVGLPAEVNPGDTHEIIVEFVVSGCEVDMGGFDVFPVRAASGLAPARVVDIPAPASRPTTRTTYRTQDSNETITLPVWPEQPPSWLLDSIDAVCLTPPDQFDD